MFITQIGGGERARLLENKRHRLIVNRKTFFGVPQFETIGVGRNAAKRCYGLTFFKIEFDSAEV